MFDFLKKYMKNGAVQKNNTTKSASKNKKAEEYIASVAEKAGWSVEQAKTEMQRVKKEFGLSFKDYDRYNFHQVAEEECEEKAKAILEKKAADKQRREEAIAGVMEATGWDREKTVAAMKKAKQTLGISYTGYKKHGFYKLTEAEQKKKYQEIKAKKNQPKTAKQIEREHAIDCIMRTTGWSREETISRVKEARERTGCTYKEFFIYRFAELSEKEQAEVFLIRDSMKLRKKYDVDKKLISMLCNKEKTNDYFSEYLKRPWCVNTKVSFREFKEKFADSKRVIYKPLAGNRGRGVEAFEINDDNIKQVYEQLATYPAGVVEQYVKQHPDVSGLSPSSVNTLRVVTISSADEPVTPDGKYIDVAYSALRIGGGNSVVDNFHSGGMVAVVDLATGQLATDAADMEGHVFPVHPITGKVFKGFKIPYFEEAMEMAIDACRKHKITGYLGWDVAITEDGPVLIEVNAGPGVVLLSTPYAADHKGMKYVMEKYL